LFNGVIGVIEVIDMNQKFYIPFEEYKILMLIKRPEGLVKIDFLFVRKDSDKESQWST
jgi:hypothetical protein